MEEHDVIRVIIRAVERLNCWGSIADESVIAVVINRPAYDCVSQE